MPATYLHKPTGKYLTSFGTNATAGNIKTISFWSTSKLRRHGRMRPDDGLGTPMTNEFTTYLLGEQVAADEFGPLFDLNACAKCCPIDYSGHPTADEIVRLSALPDLIRYPAIAA